MSKRVRRGGGRFGCWGVQGVGLEGWGGRGGGCRGDDVGWAWVLEVRVGLEVGWIGWIKVGVGMV